MYTNWETRGQNFLGRIRSVCRLEATASGATAGQSPSFDILSPPFLCSLSFLFAIPPFSATLLLFHLKLVPSRLFILFGLFFSFSFFFSSFPLHLCTFPIFFDAYNFDCTFVPSRFFILSSSKFLILNRLFAFEIFFELIFYFQIFLRIF